MNKHQHYCVQLECFYTLKAERIPSVSAFVASLIKGNESRYDALFVVRGSIKKPFSFDCVNIYLFSIFISIDFSTNCVNDYLFSIFFPIDFGWYKSVGLIHVAYVFFFYYFLFSPQITTLKKLARNNVNKIKYTIMMQY